VLATSGGGFTGNNLIDSLRRSDRDTLAAKLGHWSVKTGQIIYEPGDNVDYAYFPIGASMAAFRISFEDGSDVETALIGREGALGGIVSRGRLPAFARSVAQVGGDFVRISIRELETIKAENPRLGELFNRYADCLVAQIFQATACNAAHSVEQRAAKWLLSAAERSGSCAFTLTQNQLAGLLGVGRTYASRVIGRLRSEGTVSTERSRITIVDIKTLKALSCGCNACVQQHFDTVLQGVYPSEPDPA
jgi:CRP-like cAMP-binding protein